MVTPSMPGAPLLAFTRFHAWRRLSLSSTACSKSWLIAFTSSSFKARCVARAAASRPVGFGDAVEMATSAPCVLLFSPSLARLLANYYGVC